ncbi:hypothetical protein [Rubrolithibacter danxiaensis]|uniref:hypothetical protein n=1 Tax=Rubrolithibacter danxiaensis TaxID=3390805 RepID=UPI003BF8672A
MEFQYQDENLDKRSIKKRKLEIVIIVVLASGGILINFLIYLFAVKPLTFP